MNIPVKEIIVNDDSQVRLLEDDGTAYLAADASPSAGGFILEGFLSLLLGSQLQLLRAATRIIKDTPAAGVPETAAYTITAAAGILKDSIFRVVTDSIDLTPTEFQNRPLEKRYQTSAASTNAATTVAQMVAAINADKNATVTAFAGFNNASPVQDDSAKIVLVAKSPGIKVDLYMSTSVAGITLAKVANGTTVYHTAEDTSVTTAVATLPINTYDYLKNIEWHKNLDFDRNMNWMPLPGKTYNSYYFEVNGTAKVGHADGSLPSEVPGAIRTGYKVWAVVGSTLATKLDLLVTDMNV
jgi:hypothetical protein